MACLRVLLTLPAPWAVKARAGDARTIITFCRAVATAQGEDAFHKTEAARLNSDVSAWIMNLESYVPTTVINLDRRPDRFYIMHVVLPFM